MIDLDDLFSVNSYQESARLLEEVEQEFRDFVGQKQLDEAPYTVDYEIEGGRISLAYVKDNFARSINITRPSEDWVILDGRAERVGLKGQEKAEIPVGSVKMEYLEHHLEAVYGALEEPDNWERF